MTFAPHGVIDDHPSKLFDIFKTNVSGKAMLLPKHMELAYATGPFTFTTTSRLLPLITSQ